MSWWEYIVGWILFALVCALVALPFLLLYAPCADNPLCK
jgi:hypothetical protein